MSGPKKSLLEIALMPLVIAGLGIGGTWFITKYEEDRDLLAQEAEFDRIQERARKEQELQASAAETECQLKLLEVFGDKLTSKDKAEQILALKILQGVDPTLAEILTKAVFQAGPSPEVSEAARGELLRRLSIQAAASPPTVAPGERTTIRAIVRDRQGAPVPEVEVEISAGGGRFLSRADERYDPRSRLHGPYSAAGATDSEGVFTTWWVCKPAAAGYGMTIKANKDGYLRAEGELTIKVDPNRRPQPAPRTRFLTVQSIAAPAQVSVGERATITVLVRDEGGKAVPGARVKVSSGGGKFLTSATARYDPQARLHGPYSAEGISDAQGRFTTWWVVNPAAAGYSMGVSATKDGYVATEGRLDVSIRH